VVKKAVNRLNGKSNTAAKALTPRPPLPIMGEGEKNRELSLIVIF